MRFAALALLVAAACEAAPRVYDRSCDVASRRSDRGGVACGSGPFVLAASYAFGTFATPTVESGAYLCKVNDAGNAWECVDSAGASAGTVTQGSGSTYVSTFAGSVKALGDITDAKSPSWSHTGLGIFDGDFTVIVSGFATTASDPTYQYWIEAGNFAIRVEGASLQARFGSGGLHADSSDPTRDDWVVITARKNGTSHTARVNGVNGTPNVFADDLPTGVTAVDFGGFLPLRGPMAWVLFVPRHMTDDEVRQVESSWWGVTSGMTVTTSPNCIDNTGVSGQVDCFKAGAALASTVTGMRTVRAFTNYDNTPLAVASWADIGTPVVVANVASGPFSRMLQAAEVDSLEDNAAGSMEGKRLDSMGTTLGPYTCSFFIAAGTLSTARVRLDTDGTGSTNCDFTGLTATYERKTCTATVSGTPSRINCEIYPGTAAGDTGTILISQGQENAGFYAETPVRVGGAVGNSDQLLTFGTLPDLTTKGKMEAVFTPLFNVNTQWLSDVDNIRLFDSSIAIPGHVAFIIFGYQNAGDALSRVNTTEISLAPGTISTTAGQRYAASIEWRGSGSTCTAILRLDSCAGAVADCFATTEIGRATGDCPDQSTQVFIGERYSETFQTSASYDVFRVYQ